MTSTLFPDVLGAITGGERVNAGVAQIAAGVRPRNAPAGRPFEVALLVQNASDTKLDVTVTLHLPKSMIAKSTKLVVGLGPAEVGYVSLPVVPAREAIGNHKIGVEVDVKPLAKPTRVRRAEGGEPFDAATLPEDRAKRISGLRSAAFSTSKRLGLGTVLDLPVQVGASGELGAAQAPNAGWVSLWTMGDVNDDRVLVERLADVMRYRVLPQLKRDHTVLPLADETMRRFEAAHYTLHRPEALMIAKMMALVLEFAAPRENAHDPLKAGNFDLTPMLTKSGGGDSMPHWTRAMFRLMGRDDRAVSHAVSAITRVIYDDLLHDAIYHAFTLVEINTGEDVGSDSEKEEYAARLLNSLKAGEGLDFVYVYMPLVIGGITINDQITPKSDNAVEALRELWLILDERRLECDENSQPVLDITEQVLERALQTYGYRRGST